jgi:hypothetical protein
MARATVRSEQPETVVVNGSEHLAYGVTAEEFYRDFRDVANLVGSRPIVTAVHENEKAIENLRVDNDKEHRTIRLQVYFFLAVTAGAVLSALGIRYGVLG